MSTKTMKTLNDTADGRLTLGKAIRSIRMSEEIKQCDFAKTLKVTQFYLSDIENDRKEVSDVSSLLCSTVAQM